MDAFELEIGARLTLLQSVLEHMLADSMATTPNGASGLKNIKAAVLRSIIDNGRSSQPTSDDDQVEFEVNFRTVTDGFFERTEGLRAQLAAMQKRP